MPELPEVETMRRGIAPIVGLRIDDMRIPPSPLRPISMDPPVDEFRRRVAGRTVVAVGRLGKRVLVELDSGERIVIEPRMTGRVLLAEPPDLEHLRVVFALSRGKERDQRSRLYGRGSAVELRFWDSRGLGVVRLMTADEIGCRLGRDVVGPDALEISVQELREELSTSRRAIKVALLDQSVLAGVGNIYASELLHRARLHPAIPCHRIRLPEWPRLQAAMQEVLREAIEHEGSTLADGMYRNVQGAAGRFQDQHRVYQRAGQACRQCGRGKIVRIVQAQRSTFYCPNCQRSRRIC